MNEQNFLEDIIDFLDFEEKDTSINSEFREKVDNWDSMKAFALISYVEDEYETEVSFDDLKELKTFNDIYRFINKSVK